MSRLATRPHEAIGAEIRKRRIAAGLTQRELTRRLGVTQAYTCDIEHGHRRPSPRILERLRAELGISERYAHFLLGEIPPDVYAIREPDEATVLDAWMHFMARLNGATLP